ncbi:hypothetical protein [Pontibacter harenae]|uniref:hypothetical protein n=1 Tax=Pontibacter harenae TaxID=2894083 RepID=UPI001E2CDE96|nr:hypothetical protein [Pontibacter harenae]
MAVSGASAQTTQGRKSLPASAVLAQKTLKTKEQLLNFSLTPSVGYFIKDGLEAGVSLDYTSYKFEAGSDFLYAERRRQIAFVWT